MKKESEILARYNLPEELPENYSIRQLTGDASTRSYFRIRTPSGHSFVLMKMPEPFDEKNLPYLENYHLFRSAGVNLAEIYFLEPSRGFVFLRDLGDFTYYELYAGWNHQSRTYHYLRALDALRNIERAKPNSSLAFDTEKLSWELDFFRRHFMSGLLGLTLSEQETTELQDHFLRLADELVRQPRVFCHRDYHSRNLMLHENRLYIVDFQDARYGPTTYDLASLCYDSYLQHAQDLIRHLEQFFFTYHPDAQIQRYEYPRMCLQRNLKALGTFGYQITQMGREFYRQFVEPTLGYVKQHFEKLPEYAEMRRLLATHLPELR